MNILLDAFFDANYGDDIFVTAITGMFPRCKFYAFLEHYPEKIVEWAGKIENLYLMPEMDVFADKNLFDVYLCVGGDVFPDQGNYEKRKSYIRAVKEGGGRIVFLGFSAFRTYSPQTRRELREMLGCADIVAVRDERSAETLREIVPEGRIRVMADLAFESEVLRGAASDGAPQGEGLSGGEKLSDGAPQGEEPSDGEEFSDGAPQGEEPSDGEELSDGKRQGERLQRRGGSPAVKALGISVRRPDYADEAQMEAYLEGLAQIAESYLGQHGEGEVKIFSLSSGRSDDTQVARLLERKIKGGTIRQVIYEGDAGVIVEEMRSCEAVICTRLHAMVTCMALGIPFIPVIYEVKMEYMLKEVGFTGYMIRFGERKDFERLPMGRSGQFIGRVDRGSLERYLAKSEDVLRDLRRLLETPEWRNPVRKCDGSGPVCQEKEYARQQAELVMQKNQELEALAGETRAGQEKIQECQTLIKQYLETIEEVRKTNEGYLAAIEECNRENERLNGVVQECAEENRRLNGVAQESAEENRRLNGVVQENVEEIQRLSGVVSECTQENARINAMFETYREENHRLLEDLRQLNGQLQEKVNQAERILGQVHPYFQSRVMQRAMSLARTANRQEIADVEEIKTALEDYFHR